MFRRSTVKNRLRLHNEARYHTSINTVLIKFGDRIYKDIVKISELSNDPKNLSAIRKIALAAVKNVDILDSYEGKKSAGTGKSSLGFPPG
jgi:hypothetical protein